MIRRGEIVEVSCKLPNDSPKVHMVLVVSDEQLQTEDSGLFYGVMITTENYHSEYKVEITPDMLVKPLKDKSYFATHLLGMFSEMEVMKHCQNAIKQEYIDDIINKVIDSIFGEE